MNPNTLSVNQLRSEFKGLVHPPHRLCVSIYMPIYQEHAQPLQNPVRLKNLLRQAQELLGANRRPPGIARQILQPALTLLKTKDFWRHQDKGLVILLTENNIRHYRLPLVFEELVVVADQFYLNPLCPLVIRDTSFQYPRSTGRQLVPSDNVCPRAKDLQFDTVPNWLDSDSMAVCLAEQAG